jgi:hypothetical protein
MKTSDKSLTLAMKRLMSKRGSSLLGKYSLRRTITRFKALASPMARKKNFAGLITMEALIRRKGGSSCPKKYLTSRATVFKALSLKSCATAESATRLRSLTVSSTADLIRDS